MVSETAPMKKYIALGVVLLISVATGARAQSTQPTREEKIRQYIGLEKQIAAEFASKDYAAALKTAHALIDLAPKQPDGHYNLACALARMGQTDDALAALASAVESGYADPSHLRQDDDLASLHADKRFDDLLKKSAENQRNAPFEKGIDLGDDVKTIEAFPEGGLRYRLRMPATATREKPARLIVWLHPSGGSMDNVVEGLAPTLAKHGYALAVFTQKQFMGWTSDDAQLLIDKTLPAIAKTEGLDAARPILMGFSAGGQMALLLWHEHPEQCGGLVLDAAYAIDTQHYDPRNPKLLDLPKGEGFKKTPLLVVVGASVISAARCISESPRLGRW